MPSIFDSIIPYYTYCETMSGVIAQPLNFLSCVVFWLAAVWMWHTRSEDDETPSFHQVSAILLFVLGLTGMAWHVGQQSWAQALDMFMVFMLLIVVAVTVCNDVMRFDLVKGMGVLIALIIVSALMKDQKIGLLPQNGGLFLPTLFFLAISALKVQTKSEEVTVYLLTSSYLLFFGLIARSLDDKLCGYIPVGTHFVWHIFLAASILYMGKTIILMKDVTWDGEGESGPMSGDDFDAGLVKDDQDEDVKYV